MNKPGLQYIQLVYFYRLLLVRYLVLFNLVSLLDENLQEEDPSLGENENTGEPPLEPADCFEKGRIGQQVTGKELDEETGLMYFGARYYDPKISSWISTDPIINEYLPSSDQLFFPEEVLDPYAKLRGIGGVYNDKNINLYHYAGWNPIKYTDPNGTDTYFDKNWKIINKTDKGNKLYQYMLNNSSAPTDRTPKPMSLARKLKGFMYDMKHSGIVDMYKTIKETGKELGKAIDTAKDAIKVVDEKIDDAVETKNKIGDKFNEAKEGFKAIKTIFFDAPKEAIKDIIKDIKE
jgi:uncharacterized protein RhaS with RHS repeats